MPSETDARLRSHLDGNQPSRERLCVAVLQLDRNYSGVRPRQPSGGPDGGRDIEATLKDVGLAYGAVGFLNNASDTAPQRRRIKNKFRTDLAAAMRASPQPQAFVFMTNVALTVTDKKQLQEHAAAAGLSPVDIFDRERLRILLDSPDGLATRYHFLDLTLSNAEQQAFFSRWGSDIHSLIATSFNRLETSVRRMLFLQEATLPLDVLSVRIQLRRHYTAEEMGHFRFFYSIHLKNMDLDMRGFLLGVCDGRRDLQQNAATASSAGLANGISTGCWMMSPIGDNNLPDKWQSLSAGQGIGCESLDRVAVALTTSTLFRLFPGVALRHMDASMSIGFCSQALADKLARIDVFANDYRLASYTRDNLSFDTSSIAPELPTTFSATNMLEPWVRIRHTRSSWLRLEFSDTTPQRTHTPEELN